MLLKRFRHVGHSFRRNRKSGQLPIGTGGQLLSGISGQLRSEQVANLVRNMQTDGAFKLFVYICLHARRDTGTLEINQTQLARNLRKSQGNIRKNLRELQIAGVCKVQLTQSRHIKGTIEITTEYWPYDQQANEPQQKEETAYIAAVKKLLLARACVHTPFSAADERLAREWFDRRVPLDRVEQAILLSCCRKYISWRNGQAKAPINSLRYFESTLEEVQNQKVDSNYWEFIRFRMQRVEKLWIQNQQCSTIPNEESEKPKQSDTMTAKSTS